MEHILDVKDCSTRSGNCVKAVSVIRSAQNPCRLDPRENLDLKTSQADTQFCLYSSAIVLYCRLLSIKDHMRGRAGTEVKDLRAFEVKPVGWEKQERREALPRNRMCYGYVLSVYVSPHIRVHFLRAVRACVRSCQASGLLVIS